MILTEELEDKFKYGRYVLHVDMAFDNILKLFYLLDDDSFTEHEKIIIALEMLLLDYEKIEELPFDDQYELFKYIMREFLNVDLDKQQNESKNKDNQVPEEKEYDFKIDSERIYASFFMDYGMDLIEQQGKLHWKKFIALLNGLSKDTAFMQVVNIRTMEVPPIQKGKGNEKYRAEIIQLKNKYSLLTDEEKIARMDSQFDGIANAVVKAGEKNGS